MRPPFAMYLKPVKLNDIVKGFPDLSIHTIKKDLQLLVQQQMISKAGDKKGTAYMKLIK